MNNWYVGTMGFGYKPWQGTFYPDKLPKTGQLPYYAGVFNALEMDSTFYGTPKADSVERWREATPEGFKFCPKAPREITHDLRLAPATEGVLHNFLDTMRLLGDRLGPVVFQFPPDFPVAERDNLAAFLPRLPRDFRYAVELRHRSWWSDETADLFRAQNVCWIVADYIYLPKQIRRTADFLYLRFLGRHGQFAVKTHEVLDKTADLQSWLVKIEPHLPDVTDVYGFFNDDYAGHAPATARRFMALLGLDIGTMPPQQGRLF
jgi:uncharacterized protein YecE (DUF72 family)